MERARRWIWPIVAVLYVAAVTVAALSPRGTTFAADGTTAHIVAAAIGTIVAYGLFQRYPGGLLCAVAAVSVSAGAVEAAQLFTGRAADPADIVDGIIGAVAGAAIVVGTRTAFRSLQTVRERNR